MGLLFKKWGQLGRIFVYKEIAQPMKATMPLARMHKHCEATSSQN